MENPNEPEATLKEKPVKKGDMVTLTIDSIGFEGKSIARINDFVVFLPMAAPGDLVEVEITKVKSSYAEGWIKSLLKPGPSRIKPVCSHFGECGGCKWQHISYETQLKAKHQQVIDALVRVGGFENPQVLPIIGVGNPFNYRNKMDFTFSDSRWLTSSEIKNGIEKPEGFALGLHVPGRYDKLVDLDACHIQPETGNRILNLVKSFCFENGVLPYSSKSHTGFLRSLILRFGINTGDLMVILVTTYEDSEFNRKLADLFKHDIPEIKSFVNILHSGKGPVPKGEGEITVFGSGVLTEKLLGVEFIIHPNSFFQTNSLQAEVLFATAFEAANLKETDILFDLFCGPGTIGLMAANRVKKVAGIELIPEAVENAIENARANGINNASFVQGDIGKSLDLLKQWEENIGKPDIIVVDPPRAGLTEETARFLPQFGADRILYISCNPMTQARDLKIIASFNYDLTYIRPVDMFPHTYHIENIVVLKKRS
ncbi:MAG: 23S rRNA (uracil(1939)-C(5))-methyltransferase RlmD [Bacteroidetes bacterium]|nr:23S rRNA (uracil(1939)-C(5))-methyltransferase RlmD [Bacteroidota bacterium]